MKQMNSRKTVGLAIMLVLLPALAMAFGGQERGRGPQGPPQAAIDACNGKNIGNTVEFNNRRNETITGICEEISGQMIAVPEGGHRGKGRR